MPVGPATETADHRLVRRVLCVRGTMPFRARMSPRFDYGRRTHTVDERDGGVLFGSTDLSLSLTATVPLRCDGRDVEAEFILVERESAVFALDRVDGDTAPRGRSGTEAEELFDATVTYWRRWLSASRYRGRWREMVHRSALTLKLLTYAPTGAIVAAPTTSLPGQLGGERDWDYPFVWIRDAAFCVYALLRLGFTSEAAAFMNFLAQHVSPAGDHPLGPLQITYGTDGRTDLAEEELPHLEGYEGASPVRIGNGAAEQLQLDIYGELIDSVYRYDKWAEPISGDAWEGLCGLVDWVCDHWDQPDEGIWETRGGRKKVLHSRLMCRVAVERAIRMANRRGLPADRARWERTRDDIYRRIMKRGWSARRQAFVQHEDDVLDAAVLMMPLAKFVAPTDPKWLPTLDALSGELVSDSLVYRYDPEASGTAGRRPDGVREDADVRQPPRPLRRADRRRRRSAGQLPPGLHPPGAHQHRREPRSGPGLTPAWSRPVGPPVHRGRGGPAGLSVSGAAACSR